MELTLVNSVIFAYSFCSCSIFLTALYYGCIQLEKFLFGRHNLSIGDLAVFFVRLFIALIAKALYSVIWPIPNLFKLIKFLGDKL